MSNTKIHCRGFKPFETKTVCGIDAPEDDATVLLFADFVKKHADEMCGSCKRMARPPIISRFANAPKGR